MACPTSQNVSANVPVVLAAHVRAVPGDDHVDLCFVLRGKQHKMHRPIEEHIGKTLKRLLISLNKLDKQGKRSQRKHVSKDEPGITEAQLYAQQHSKRELVSEDTPNKEALVEGSLLVIDGVSYVITVNAPTVTSLKMAECVLIGSAAIPEVEVEFADLSVCKWTWRRLPLSDGNLSVDLFTDIESFPLVNTTFVYWPSKDDMGHQLLVECLPSSTNGRTGTPSQIVSPVVTDPPQATPITHRHLYTPARLAANDQFRVITYNILAEPFTNSAYAHNVLYPYCDPSALHISYRQSQIVHELLGYNGDVICLQEMGSKTYERFLLPALRDKGYDGCFRQKSGVIQEGEAIFFEMSKFSLVSVESSSLNVFFQSDPSCADMYKGLMMSPFFFQEVMKKHNVILSAFLKSKEMPDHYLLVANTHLYYHPKGDHVRLVQIAIAMNFLKTKLEAYRQTVSKEAKIATVICGDFNSCPCIGAYEYVLSGKITRQHPDWMVYKLAQVPKCNCEMKRQRMKDDSSSSESESESETDAVDVAGPGEDQVGSLPASKDAMPTFVRIPKRRLSTIDDFKGLDLEHQFHFENACGTKHFTNVTLGYSGILDYIFIDSDHLSVKRTIPLPSHREVTEFVALPSVYFPSDHLSLVADIQWK